MYRDTMTVKTWGLCSVDPDASVGIGMNAEMYNLRKITY